MSKSLFIYALPIALAVFLLFSSCKRCTSCAESITNTGASLSGPDSIAKQKSATLLLTPVNDVQKRTCLKNKDNICVREMTVSVTCNKELQLQKRTYPAGYDLLSDETIIDTRIYKQPDRLSETQQLTIQPGVTFQPGTYIFYLDGTSGAGSPIHDTAQITWIQP